MTPDLLFDLCNYAVLPGWALLLFAPGWRWTQRISAILIPLLLAVVYAVLIATTIFMAEGDMSSLDGVATLFQNRWVLVAGWVHYLVFDLFIGSWEVRDARRLGIRHLAVVPCLFLTLMLGPVGLLAYFGLRVAVRREVGVEG